MHLAFLVFIINNPANLINALNSYNFICVFFKN